MLVTLLPKSSSIAIDEVLCRLVSKSLAHSVCHDAFNVLTPSQVGVSVNRQCDTIIHFASQPLDDPSISRDEWWFLFLDFKNAFNSIDRAEVLGDPCPHTPSGHLDRVLLWLPTLPPLRF